MNSNPIDDSVSLGDIEGELGRVQAEKQEHLRAVESLEQEEARLASLAHALRDFLTYRNQKAATPDEVSQEEETVPPSPEKRPEAGPGIVERAVIELGKRQARETLDTWQLIREMEKSGFTSGAADIYLSVYGTLNRAAKRPQSKLVKDGSRWGLRDWYPDGVPAPQHQPEGGQGKEEQPMLISDEGA